MLCDICHKNIATVHLTEIIKEKVVEMHICQPCAKVKAEELKDQLSISDLLGGLVGMGNLQGKISLKCSFCGLTYEDFKKKGNLGCGECYRTFKFHLAPILKKIHGATRHTGKVPQRRKRVVSHNFLLGELKSRLEAAIKIEQYEEAAKLRDQIRELEKVDQRLKTKEHNQGRDV